jgi:exopolysaccharide biosynthesis polyprenyl glycosylphosphotransferase
MATGALEAQTAERWAAELPGAPGWPSDRRLADAGARRRLQSALALLDPLALATAWLFALLGDPHPLGPRPLADWLLSAGSITLAAVWWRRGGLRSELLEDLRALLLALSLSVLAMLGLASLLGTHTATSLGVRLWVLALALGATSALSRRWLQRAGGAALLRPTLIVGAGQVGRELAAQLEREPQHGLRIVGFLEAPPRPSSSDAPARSRLRAGTAPGAGAAPVLGSPIELEGAIAASGAECVIFAFAGAPDSTLVALIEQCRRRGVTVLAVPRLYELAYRDRTQLVGPLPLAELRALDPRGPAFQLKHAIDRLVAAVLLALLAPLLALLVIAIKLDSPGSVLYRQRRVGRDGRHFMMLKLRTMLPAPAEQPMFVPAPGCAPGGNEAGKRCTRLGAWLRRSSLDELPQLVNVLRGEMSLIGPRPERPEYVERFAADVIGYERRHRVKSGITGLAQVNGLRGQTSIFNRARYDNAYIEQWSFWLDFKIAVRTIGVMVSLRGR